MSTTAQRYGHGEPDVDDLARSAFKTAIRRRHPSLPARTLLPTIRRWLQAGTGASADICDYGCGTGADVSYYRGLGFDADGYDPHPPFGYASPPVRRYRVVTVFYVLNVIPAPAARVDALRRAAALLAPAGRLVVATRSSVVIGTQGSARGWRVWGDGFVSHDRRLTFQRGFDQAALGQLGSAAGLRPAGELPRVPGATVIALQAAVQAAGPGVVAGRFGASATLPDHTSRLVKPPRSQAFAARSFSS